MRADVYEATIGQLPQLPKVFYEDKMPQNFTVLNRQGNEVHGASDIPLPQSIVEEAIKNKELAMSYNIRFPFNKVNPDTSPINNNEIVAVSWDPREFIEYEIIKRPLPPSEAPSEAPSEPLIDSQPLTGKPRTLKELLVHIFNFLRKD